MKKISRWVLSLLAAIAFIGIATTTQAAVAVPVVDFTNILDGNGDPSLFDPAMTLVDPNDGNILNIGLNNFTAELGTMSALDTLSLIITAPQGYYINALNYTESGTGMTASDGVAIATGSIVVNNVPVNFVSQIFTANSASQWSISPILPPFNDQTSVVAVSITNSLFAVGSDANTWITKDYAALTVDLTPASVPIPSTMFLLGSGLFAITFRMRRKN